MTFRNTEYLVLVDANGDFVSGQTKRVQLAQDGTPFPAPPVDFDQADLSGLFGEFNAVVLRENTALKAQVASLTASNASTVTQMQSTINQLTTDHSAAMSSLQTQLATAQAAAVANEAAAQLTPGLQAQVATLETRVASLASIATFDQRKITVAAFMERLTRDELLMLTDVDPTTAQIAAMLREWKTNDWPIFLDQDESPEFAMAMGYFMQTGRLTPERVAQLTVDSARHEAPAV